MPDRQPILNELIALFDPVGPTEQILIGDLADYRMQLKDADQRRQAVLDTLGEEAVRLYHSRLKEEFEQLHSLWTFEPARQDKSMRQSMLGLDFYLSNLHQLKLQLNEGRINADENQFLTFLRQLIGKTLPTQMSESSLRLLYAYISLIDKMSLKPLLIAWNPYFKVVTSNAALDWYIDNEPQFPQPEEALQLLHESVDRLIQTCQASYEILIQRHSEECRRFAYGYRANREFNESLRNIFADRRTIQLRHDQALRHLTQVQERRCRISAKSLEKTTRQAVKTLEIEVTDKPESVRPEHDVKPVREFTISKETTDSPVSVNEIHENAHGNYSSDISSLIELELNLADGNITDIPFEKIQQVFQFWPDQDLDYNSPRFHLVFGKITSQIQIHEVKEVLATEKKRRNDINKLLEAA